MLALIILGGLAAYVAIGHKCACIDIRDSVENEASARQLEDGYQYAFHWWPAWIFTEGIRIGFKKRVLQERTQYKELKEAETEVQKLLEE